MSDVKLRYRLVALFALSFIAGLFLTHAGMETWDSLDHLTQSRWLIQRYLHQKTIDISPIVTWYGPLWESILGVFSFGLFDFVHDPTWIRYSVNFTLLPITLLLLFVLLRRNGVDRATSWLALALLTGCVRFVGHSLINTKDFPLACSYLLVTLALRDLITRQELLPEEQRLGFRVLLQGTLLALIPYLVRIPMVLHFLFWWGWVGLEAFKSRRLRPGVKRVGYALLPFFLGIFFVILLWPRLWGARPPDWIQSFRTFSQFKFETTVMVFGKGYPSTALPWWYPLAWIPVIFHPLALLTVVAGLGGVVVQVFRKRVFGVEVWLAAFLLAPWLLMIVRHSILYDEERHLLFLYSMAAVLAALGLGFMSAREKYALALALCVVSVFSYVSWGRFSYIYKSPLVGDTRAERFMGDYWGVCVSPLLNRLPGRLPPNATIVSYVPPGALTLQVERIHESIWPPTRGFGSYVFKPYGPKPEKGYFIAYNRTPEYAGVLASMGKEHVRILDQVEMPTGEPACILGEYSP